MLGRPFSVWAMPPFSLPVNELGLPAGNSDFRLAVLTAASSPLWAPECTVEPSQ